MRFGASGNEDKNDPRQLHLRLTQTEAALDTLEPRQALQYNQDAKNMERLNGDRGEQQTQADMILVEYLHRQLGEKIDAPAGEQPFSPYILSEVVSQRQTSAIRYLWYYTYNSIDTGYFEQVRNAWDNILGDLDRQLHGEASVRLTLRLEAHTSLARSYSLVHQWSLARSHFEKALSLSDDFYSDYNDITAILERDFAETLLRMGSIDEAKLRLNRANHQFAQGFPQDHSSFRRSQLIDIEILLQSRAFDRASKALQVLHEQLQAEPSSWPWQDRAHLFAQMWYVEQAMLGCPRWSPAKHREKAQAEWSYGGEIARLHREFWTQKILAIESRAACP